MKRGLFVLVLSMMLGGCALPVGVQIASWALDGISLVATKKSMTDHGLSILTQKDCAMWRVVKQEKICVHYQDATIAIAQKLDDEDDNFEHVPADTPTLLAENVNSTEQAQDIAETTTQSNEASVDLNIKAETPIEVEQLANFATAAGGDDDQKSTKINEKTAIQLVKLTSKTNKLTKLTGYAAGTFSGAVVDMKSRSEKLSRFSSQQTMKREISPKELAFNEGQSQNLRFAQGYSAASFSSAWAYQQGQEKPKVKWVFAASPAPQQHQDLTIEITEVALNQDSGDIDTQSKILIEAPVAPTTLKVDETPSFSEVKYDQEALLSEDLQLDDAFAEPANLTSRNDVYFVVASFDDTQSATKLLNHH
jgi:hypothetical protein